VQEWFKKGTGEGKADNDLITIWEDIEAWYRTCAPELIGDLAPPAREKDLLALEVAIETPIPESLRSSLLRHDGTIHVDAYRCLSSAEIFTTWQTMTTLADRGTFAGVALVYWKHDVFRNTWWHHRWIPFATDSAGNLFCADAEPGPNGRVGQVLRWEVVEGPSDTGYTSFIDWLKQHRNELLAGAFKIDEDGLLARRLDA